MPIVSTIKRAVDWCVQGVLLVFYFLYYLVRGRDDDENDLCIGTDTKSGSTGSAVDSTTNICCIHGVQTRPIGYVPPPLAPRAFRPVTSPVATQTDNAGKRGWLYWLNPKHWFSREAPSRPVLPPRPFQPYAAHHTVPSGSSAPGQSDDRTTWWLWRMLSYLPWFGKKVEKGGTDNESRPPPFPQPVLKMAPTSVTSEPYGQTDFARDLRHAVEPHYPVTLESVPPAAQFVPPGQAPSRIPARPENETIVKIHMQAHKQTPAGPAPMAWSPPHSTTVTHVETRPPPAPPSGVRGIGRQWPPPSNAMGMIKVKDMVFPHERTDGETSPRSELSQGSAYEERTQRQYSTSQYFMEKSSQDQGNAISPVQQYHAYSQELSPSTASIGNEEMLLRRRHKVEKASSVEYQPAPVPPSAPMKRFPGPTMATEQRNRQGQPQFHHFSPPPSLSNSYNPEQQQLFSPRPFSPESSRGRPFTQGPKGHQQAYRSQSMLGDRMEQKEYIDWSKGPEMTTTIISATAPSSTRTVKKSTYVASHGSYYSQTSTVNASPRSWKSYSEAYGPSPF